MKSSGSPEEVAASVLARAKVTQLPVSVKNIARLYDVKVLEDKLEGGASGYLIRDKGRALIVLEKNESLHRQRFTIAHELGHLLMHAGRPLLVDADTRINERKAIPGDFATSLEERQANQFAAALLMPDLLVEQEVERLQPGRDVAKELARICNVSVAAMQFRLVNLGLQMPTDLEPIRRQDRA